MQKTDTELEKVLQEIKEKANEEIENVLKNMKYKADEEMEKNGKKIKKQKNSTKFHREYTKNMVDIIILTYFFGVIFGAYIVLKDTTQFAAYAAFIATPTATAIGFYCWKAKAENAIRMSTNKQVSVGDIINTML